MDRLRAQLDRLYGLAPAAAASGVDDRPADIRVAVLAAQLPAGWDALSQVWRGVQSDLGLPAPAIAVSGSDALHLWFSFAVPVSPVAAAGFLQALAARYLAGVAPSLLRALADAAALPPAPCVEIGPQRWSAFVTHDLASIFGETPWLDLPPNDEGQASILRALEPMGQGAVAAALQSLGPRDDALPAAPAPTAVPVPPGTFAASAALAAGDGSGDADPAGFLAAVMNDATAPLALRIEAARILLPYARRS